MPEPVIAILKLVFLAALYLFLARVVRAVWVELYAERRSAAERVHAGVREQRSKGDVPVPTVAPQPLNRREKRNDAKAPKPLTLKVIEPPEQKGTTFPITDEMTIGRAPACAVPIKDDFASQLHARMCKSG